MSYADGFDVKYIIVIRYKVVEVKGSVMQFSMVWTQYFFPLLIK